jgi:predicted transcriptional regulator/prophage maintenance system killer protein
MASAKEDQILQYIFENPLQSSKQIHEGLSMEISYATIKRVLTKLIDLKLIITEGVGKATKYAISPSYGLLRHVDSEQYYTKEIDERIIQEGFNFQLLKDVLPGADLFTDNEFEKLNLLQRQYKANITDISNIEYEKEIERLAIDLSWKSSQIEGNTYSLLETERLLKEKETAAGKKKDEAIMLINHKDAIDFIVQNPDYIEPLKITKIEEIHSILMKELGVDKNIRNRRVGISGTNYKPLDNEYQIKENLEVMCSLINGKGNVFEKALLALVLISYIQPFVDGNKRTARIISNSILINNNYCPISFRTVDSVEYKKAMLIFYEQNNISAFKEIFIDQFEFAVSTYF